MLLDNYVIMKIRNHYVVSKKYEVSPLGKRVLVVDDEKLIVKGLKFSLEQDSMQVDCAYDGEEAVAMVKKTNYDVILLDVMLPKLSGFEVCQAADAGRKNAGRSGGAFQQYARSSAKIPDKRSARQYQKSHCPKICRYNYADPG